MKKSLHIGFTTLLVVFMFSGLSVLAQKKNSQVAIPYAIGQTATAITVDGTIDAAWDGVASYVAVDPTTWTPSPDLKSMDDASFKWSGLWDADNLYLLVQLKDDITTIGDTAKVGSAAKNWMNDNIEMVLNDPAFVMKSYKYRFSFGRDNDPAVSGGGPAGSTFATATVAGGWVLEVAIPWLSLTNDTIDFSAYPAVGKLLNMSLVQADLDITDGWNWDQLSGHIQWPKGWSTTDVELVATAPVDNTLPGTVSGVNTSNLTFGGVTLNWTAASAGDALAYLITKNEAPISYISDASVVTMDIAGLSPETEYSFKVYAVDAQGISASSVVSTVTTLAKPTLKNITIDKYNGPKANPFEDLDAWDAQSSNPLNYIVYGTNGGETDLSASFKVMWTSSNLYIQTNIVDQELDNSKAASAWWETDNVEFHFDMGNQRDGASCEDIDPDKYDQDNFQYRAIERKGELQTGSTPAPKWNGISQATYDLYDAAGENIIGYTIEVNFPWATLNATSGLTFTPANGAQFAFDMKVSDTDPVAGEGWSNSAWSTYEFSGQNRDDHQFGQMTLQGSNGISSLNSLSLNVYPNPASEYVQISMQKEVSGTATIIDMAGKQVASSSINNSRNITIDTRSINKGIYFVLVTENNLVHRAKLVIE
jgi:hypothetical protein